MMLIALRDKEPSFKMIRNNFFFVTKSLHSKYYETISS